nr:hypothetical protein [Methanocalculus taiwanensis]
MESEIRGLKIKQGIPFRYSEEEYPALHISLSETLSPESFSLSEGVCSINSSYVGHIELPNRKVEIVPRFEEIGMRQVEYMYFFVNSRQSELSNIMDLFDVGEGVLDTEIARKFITELNSVIGKGLPHLFIVKEENSDYQKGHINWEETAIRLYERKRKPFNCVYDETSINNPVSRILGAALYKLEFLITDDFVRLARFLPYCSVDEGKLLSEKYADSTIYFEYSEALYWAKVVLFDLNVISFKDGRAGSCFMVNFDLLFQDFCTKVLQVSSDLFSIDQGLQTESISFPPDTNIRYAEISKESTNSPKSIEPDILYRYDPEQRTAKVVLDCKCKERVFLPEDIYQIEFYATCLLAEKAILIYPKNSQNTDCLTIFIDNSYRRVYLKKVDAVFIDLSATTSEEFKDNIEKFYRSVLKIVIPNGS